MSSPAGVTAGAAGDQVEWLRRWCAPWAWRLRKSRLAQSIGALYLLRCAGYVAPLVTLPWLARVLGPSGLGLLAFVQGVGACVTLVVEYGFSFSATQQVSVHRHCPERLSEVMAGVQGAKVALALICGMGVAAALPWLKPLEGHASLLAAGVFAAAGQAFTMTWYFLGVERMVAQSVIEASLRLAAACGVLLLVRSPQDGWKVFALQGVAAWMAVVAGCVVAHRRVPFRLPTYSLVRDALQAGRSALFFRVAETSYTSCNSLLLGFLCPPGTVGIYAGAEKIARAVLATLLDPVQRAVYPGVARALAESPGRAACLVRQSALATGIGATAICGILFAAGPRAVRTLLGPGYEGAVLPLRILLLAPVAVSLKWALGLNWMVPAGLGKTFNRIIAASALFHLAMTLLLAPRWSAAGMAMAVALTEAAIPTCVYAVLRRRGMDPLRKIHADNKTQEFFDDSERKVHRHGRGWHAVSD